jgi:RNA polymerase sigma-70 factor, ECF subfamily
MVMTERPARADKVGVVELQALIRRALTTALPPGPELVIADTGPTDGQGDPAADPLDDPGLADGWLFQLSHGHAKARTGAHVAVSRANASHVAEGTGDDTATTRVVALVELAKKGDAEAFGQLYDHYVSTIYRYVYYRVGAHALAEDLTSETFLRALKSLSSFRWQGRDFGAWLVTIARNLVADHFKSGRFRLEVATGEILDCDSVSDGPEDDVLASLTNEALIEALKRLGSEQQECLVLRFLQGFSVTETARALGKSDGAIKQLQLRAVRNLAKLLPEGFR